MRKTIVLCFIFFLMSGIAYSRSTDFIQSYVPHANKVGTGVVQYAFWPVYRATLYAPHGVWSADKPFALTLVYQREIDGKTIAETSIQEIRRLCRKDEFQLAAWYEQMLSIFPNVQKGSRLTGLRTAEGYTLFFNGDTMIGKMTDPDFTQAFFSIWLSPRTRAPKLRQDILGHHE